jgi:hypothetical protein
MTIQELVDVCEDIALNKIELKSFYVGNTWDMAAGKGDIYPCLWFEFPILVDYSTVNTLSKQYTFSLDFLTLAKLDDTLDEINMISHMEELADLFLLYLKKQKGFPLIDIPTGLTVKSINADNALGIRLDLKVNTGRVCPDCTQKTDELCP